MCLSLGLGTTVTLQHDTSIRTAAHNACCGRGSPPHSVRTRAAKQIRCALFALSMPTCGVYGKLCRVNESICRAILLGLGTTATLQHGKPMRTAAQNACCGNNRGTPPRLVQTRAAKYSIRCTLFAAKANKREVYGKLCRVNDSICRRATFRSGWGPRWHCNTISLCEQQHRTPAAVGVHRCCTLRTQRRPGGRRVRCTLFAAWKQTGIWQGASSERMYVPRQFA